MSPLRNVSFSWGSFSPCQFGLSYYYFFSYMFLKRFNCVHLLPSLRNKNNATNVDQHDKINFQNHSRDDFRKSWIAYRKRAWIYINFSNYIIHEWVNIWNDDDHHPVGVMLKRCEWDEWRDFFSFIILSICRLMGWAAVFFSFLELLSEWN
jgi:hypothetical protein